MKPCLKYGQSFCKKGAHLVCSRRLSSCKFSKKCNSYFISILHRDFDSISFYENILMVAFFALSGGVDSLDKRSIQRNVYI